MYLEVLKSATNKTAPIPPDVFNLSLVWLSLSATDHGCNCSCCTAGGPPHSRPGGATVSAIRWPTSLLPL